VLGNLFRGTTHRKKCVNKKQNHPVTVNKKQNLPVTVNKKQNLPVTVNKKQNIEVAIPAPDEDHEIFSFPWCLGQKSVSLGFC